MARGGGRLEAAARGRRPRGRGALGLLCLAVLCGLWAMARGFVALSGFALVFGAANGGCIAL